MAEPASNPPRAKGKLARHPTVLRVLQQRRQARSRRVDLETLRTACRRAGADDVGFVPIDRPEIDGDRADIVTAFPAARTLIAFVVRMNPTAIQSPMRSIANLEFHRAGDETNEIARRIVEHLSASGHRGLNPAMGFPMEMDRFPGKLWVVSHKRIAEAAGIGKMGIHRNVIHPRLGNFILLGTVITDAEIAEDEQSRPLDYNPCLECKLCVAACPVGAIKPDGAFDFSACYVHNYREFMGGFTDWVGEVVTARSRRDYRERVSDAESASVWQSLSYGANYKAAYCMAVCPAGEDNISPYLDSKKAWKQEVLEPLRAKEESVYVLSGSDAEDHVTKRFAAKTPKVVHSGLRPTSIRGFADGVHLSFQPGRAKDVPVTRYHFDFVGDESAQMTIVIGQGQIDLEPGLHGAADLHVTADSATWLGFLAGERNIVWAIARRKIKLRGPVALLERFGACFPDP